MQEDKIEDVVGKSVDDLFAELGFKDFEATTVTRAVPSRRELVEAGRLKFEAMRRILQGIICREEVLAVARSSSSERELIAVLADAIAGTIIGFPIPIMTVAGLVAKIGINRLCRGKQSS